MKNYVRPSALVSRFDIEDVIMVSGTFNANNALNTDVAMATTDVYKDYVATQETGYSANYLEFRW